MSRLVLAELKRRYLDEGRPLPRAVEAALEADGRAGARALLEAVARRRRANRAEAQRLRWLCRYEQPLWDAGVRRVAGVDEAGMAPAAGPVCAAAVILPPGCRLPGVDDSKKLDPDRRDALEPVIKRAAVAWAVAFADAEEVDRLNVYHAGLLAMRRAVEGLGVDPEHLLVDARRLETFDVPQDAIVGGDRKSLSIAAASILAKTARDRLMVAMDRLYPGYGFARHKGYPVAAHRAALAALGPCEIHRRSFVTVREVDGGVDEVDLPTGAEGERL